MSGSATAGNTHGLRGMMHTNAASTGPIGVMGGAFDPVHYGHLRTAIELYEALQLDELLLVPSANPPHRPAHKASGTLRQQMLEVATNEQSWLRVDDRELQRSGPSWSVLTLEELRAEYGSRSLCMILGMDAFLALHTWHRWQELIDLAHIVVARRPGSELSVSGELGELLAERGGAMPEDIHSEPAGRILVYEVTQLEISSSAIRERILNSQNVQYLLPDSVQRIIIDAGCYAPALKEQKLHAK
jgi:nicotinate-nucleotide adenylyltransferase